MRYKKPIILLMLAILLLSVASVCASEVNDSTTSSEDTLPVESIQNNEILAVDSNTFTDLNNDINGSEGVFEIQHDYTFSNETDESYVAVNKSNFVINGNNHIIDGNRQSRIFNIYGENITINNLIFTNGYSANGGTLFVTGSLTLNNVTFINNNANYGGCILNGGEINCINSKFIDNNASVGYAIYSQAGTLNIENSYFISKYSNKIGSVFAADTDLIVNNCTFTNTSSRYAPAIYAKSATRLAAITINNTRFMNLQASESAGAVAIKVTKKGIIENCEFTNTSSVKNGGAVFVDIAGEIAASGAIEVSNTTFKDSKSGFGGAYLQLSGNLTMTNSIFKDNWADYNGGAVYLSGVSAIISDVKFDSNKVDTYDDYPTYGGGLFFDYGEMELTNSKFTNNSATIGGGVYIYDGLYGLFNLTFNGNGNAIYTVFDNEDSEVDNLDGNDEISADDFNHKYYPSVVAGEGMKITVLNNTINADNLPHRFDLREWGWVSPVRNQGSMGACWTFGMTAALESAILKSLGLENTDFSENNMQNSMLIYSQYGSNLIEGGVNTVGIAYLLSWLGAFPQDYDTYDELGKISPVIQTLDDIHVQDIVIVPRNPEIVGGDPAIKEAILKYGALAGYYVGTSKQDEEYPYYNEETHAQYNPNYEVSNHAICVVGWDDNYSADNFLIKPEGDGAWIIKNSWGPEWGDEGYLYVSYYDKTFCAFPDQITECAIGIVFENTVPYNKNYQYDFAGLTMFNTYSEEEELYGSPITYVNNFEAEDDDLIAAVGTYFDRAGVDYTVQIAVNDEIVLTQKGVSPYYGYHTIKLNKYVQIKKGDEFSVYIISNAVPFSQSTRIHLEEGISYCNYVEWTDLSSMGYVACIKAYTVADDSKIIANKDISVDYGGGKYFQVQVVTADGHNVAGADVKFNINGKTTPVKTNSNGIAKIKITDVPKKYTIKTTYNGKTYKNTVTVKQVLKASKVTVKKTAKKFTLKATLKINGKLVKGKTVTFKFNGKTYKVKTNAKGIAQKTLKKSVIKKLKKGKTYTVKVTYLKDTIKTTVKVK